MNILKQVFLYSSCLLMAVACEKDNKRIDLAPVSVSFDHNSKTDSIEFGITNWKDELKTVELKASIIGNAGINDHYISFAVDPNKLADFKTKYALPTAMLLPNSNYYFFKDVVKLATGNKTSEAAQLNLFQQTKLLEYSTYVLPIVIKSIDGKALELENERVIYYVFKTGKPLTINKSAWTIEQYSSYNPGLSPTNLLDANNETTMWSTNISEKMPQWVLINFNKELRFSSLTYYLPKLINFPTDGGYPTKVKIEVSSDGQSWTDKGTFDSNIQQPMQTLEIGESTARMLRFTVLQSVKYLNLYEMIIIGGISINP
ncbi:discoidin domain-containing protein [Sphingobacterium sp. HJSM2_6]|uniref:discoidin domain-containing protein n=1 Tax=Sphingobacterium sp. HJSM2_6 TaxID=3366264 RepID=UPI003BE714B3